MLHFDSVGDERARSATGTILIRWSTPSAKRDMRAVLNVSGQAPRTSPTGPAIRRGKKYG